MVCVSATPPQTHTAAFTFQSMMSRTYPPPRFSLSRPPLFQSRAQIVNYIINELCAMAADEEIVLRTALENAYPSARCEIFCGPSPSPLPLSEKTEATENAEDFFSETIAGSFIARAALEVCTPRFAKMCAHLLAYGVDFNSRNTHLPNTHSSDTHLPNTHSSDLYLSDFRLPLVPLATALRCVHAAGKVLLSAAAAQLNAFVSTKEASDSYSTVYRLLNTGHHVLSLLRFFAQEDRGDAAEMPKTTSEEKIAAYTVAEFNEIFKSGATQRAAADALGTALCAGSDFVQSISQLLNNSIHHLSNYILSSAELEPILLAQLQIAPDVPPQGHWRLLQLLLRYCRDFSAFFQILRGNSKDLFAFDAFMRVMLGTDKYSHGVCFDDAGNSVQSLTPQLSADVLPLPQPSRIQTQRQQQEEGEESQEVPSMSAAPPAESDPMFIGLKNAGNTCFINSFTQLFFAARRFRIALMREVLPRIAEVDESSPQRENLLTETASPFRSEFSENVTFGFVLLLAQMHWRLKKGHQAVAVQTDFFRNILPPPFNDGRQHDASEYAKVLLEFLDGWSTNRNNEKDNRNNEKDNENENENCESPSGAARPREMREPNSLCVASRPHTQAANKDNEEKENEEKDSGEKDSGRAVSVVARWFGGTFASFIECLRCRRTRTRRSPFWDISVPLRRETFTETNTETNPEANAETNPEANTEANPEANTEANAETNEMHAVHAAGGIVAVTTYAPAAEVPENTKPRALSLQALVDNVLNYREVHETLHGENAPFCDACRSRESALMRTAVHATRISFSRGETFEKDMREKDIDGLPFYLTLQLNRFQYDRAAERYEKVMDAVRVEESLWVNARVVTSRAQSETRRENKTQRSEEREGENENEEEEREGEEREREREEEMTVRHCAVRYRLIAALVHSGPTPRSGHYFSILKKKKDKTKRAAGEWRLANDSMISPLSAETVRALLSGSGGVFHTLETPYILLYERCGNGAGGERKTREEDEENENENENENEEEIEEEWEEEEEEEEDVVIPEHLEKLFESLLQKSAPPAEARIDKEEHKNRKYNFSIAEDFANFYRHYRGGGGPIC